MERLWKTEWGKRRLRRKAVNRWVLLLAGVYIILSKLSRGVYYFEQGCIFCGTGGYILLVPSARLRSSWERHAVR